MSASFHQLAYFIWSVADLPCGPYRPLRYEHELVMLPLNMLRRAQAPRRAVAGGDTYRPAGFYCAHGFAADVRAQSLVPQAVR